ncbi:CLUMA_CG008244, isoform A [Clunio marinus]|uniref:CLUMA_CG008244, isoform A n=1 Tax=Clunio marinus TaxID=568069 RepID=A0A1J1I365_9DIPT|nr:CLUMA_CG008244, isoform A [Clunio marinus]
MTHIFRFLKYELKQAGWQNEKGKINSLLCCVNALSKPVRETSLYASHSAGYEGFNVYISAS